MASLAHRAARSVAVAVRASKEHARINRVPPTFHYRFFSAPASATSIFAPLDTFPARHIGPDIAEADTMLKKLGYRSMEEFIADSVPAHIRVAQSTISDDTIPALSESELAARAEDLAGQNKVFRSYIGMGYHTAVVPKVILRNVSVLSAEKVLALSHLTLQVTENPAWYTQYTPYQPEIAQGMVLQRLAP